MFDKYKSKKRIVLYGKYRKGIKEAIKDAKKRGTYSDWDSDRSYNPWKFMRLYDTEEAPLKAYDRTFFKFWKKYMLTLSPEELKRREYNLLTTEKQVAYNLRELLKKVQSSRLDTLEVQSIIANAITTGSIIENATTKKDITGE